MLAKTRAWSGARERQPPTGPGVALNGSVAIAMLKLALLLPYIVSLFLLLGVGVLVVIATRFPLPESGVSAE